MGIETEYALSALSRSGRSVGGMLLVDRFFQAARKELTNVCDLAGGMFLQNGARFYIDSGLHPEFATPECSNPAETVSHVLAGEEILRGLAASLEGGRSGFREVRLFRTNVDYGGTGATWGCHESYLTRTTPSDLAQQIIPHLVSRIIYSGAGGFNPMSAGIDFSLSPRVAHLRQVVSGDSTHNRGIFHTKNESLARQGYSRLHILCGESLCSQLANYLKIGTTALVVAMIEAGLRPAEGVQLEFPLNAMRIFAADTRCSEAAALKTGKSATAIQIQRHYLMQAEEHLRRDFMPDWAGDLCLQWRGALDRLERDPASMNTTLDWALKHSLAADHIRRRGLPREALTQWNRVLTWLQWALASTPCRRKPLTAELVLGRESPLRDEVKTLTPYLGDVGLSWEGLESFLQLRQELFEIDMRFGQLGEKSLFAGLDRQGLLSHRIVHGCDVRASMDSPPAVGRARLRGKFVRRYARRKGFFTCDWRGAWDMDGGRTLDLSDPFETEERWLDGLSGEAEQLQDLGWTALRGRFRFRQVRILDPQPAGSPRGDSSAESPF